MSRPAELLADLEGYLGWEAEQGLRSLPEEPTASPGASAPNLEELHAQWHGCQRCALARERTCMVMGEGPIGARLAFIGEGPGEDEDRSGRPFVGAAGEQLTRMIGAMGMQREQVFITNIVKCRPPQNRDPEPGEVATCAPLLEAQIRLVAPEVIVCLGRHASQALLRSDVPITRLRGQWGQYGGAAVMPTYHPAYLLRNPREKGPVWEDLQAVLRRLGLPIPERRPPHK